LATERSATLSKRGQPGDPSQSNQKEAASGGKRKKNVRVPPPMLWPGSEERRCGVF